MAPAAELAALNDKLRVLSAQVAVHAEREAAARARAEKLAQANQLLRESAEALGAIDDIDAFLGQVLWTIHSLLAGHSATVWVFDHTQGLAHLCHVIEAGRAMPAAHSTHPNARTPNPFAAAANDLMPGHGTAGATAIQTLVSDDRAFTAEHRAYFQSLGVRSLVSVPMVLRGRHLGNFTVRLSDARELLDDERELIQALANQAAVALQLTRLAEADKHAAVAREQEQAAREQAAELERANAAISRTIDALAREHSVDAFLATTMKAMAEVLQVPSMTMWIYREGSAHLHFVYECGHAIPAAKSGHPEAGRPVALDSQVEAWDAGGAQRRTPLLRVVGDAAADWTRERVDHLRSFGVRALLEGVMVVDDRPVGVFTARITDDMPDPSPARLSLVQALTNQAALALEMTRLAQEAQAAEVTRERLAVVSRANDALRRTADRLADEPALDAFLGQALQALVEAFGAMGGSLWRWDGEGVVLALELSEGAIRSPPQTGHRLMRHVPRLPQALRWESLMRDGEIVAVDVEREYGFEPEAQAYLRALGVGTLVMVPLNLGSRHLGRFTLRLAAARSLSGEELALARALATQAALAMELTRLAEQAKQAAVAREREQAALLRADTLARANAAIRATLDKLAERQDLNAFLGEAVTICANELGAVGAGIWLHHGVDVPDDLILSYEDGELRPVARMQHPGKDNQRVDPQLTRLNDAELVRGEIVVEAGDALRQRPWYPACRDYLETRGIVAITSLPLFIGSRWAGTVVLRHTSVPVYPQEKQELAQALANQIALALELTRLAEAVRRAEVARERLAVIGQANDALRRTAEKLVDEPALDAFLGQALRAIVESFGGNGGAFWRWDDGAIVLSLELDAGRILLPKDGAHPIRRRLPQHPEAVALEQRLRAGEIAIFDVDHDSGFEPEARAYLQERGVDTLVMVPLNLGNRHLGRFTIRLTAARVLAAEDIEVARALATQASLAIELTQLGEQARAAAIAREQEQAARERVAALAKANDAMRVCLDQIADASDLRHLAPSVLRVLAQLLGAVGGSLWRYDGSDGSVSLDHEYAGGELHSRENSGFQHPEKHFYSESHPPSYRKNQRLIAGDTLTLDVATTEVFLLNEREHLLAQGVRTLIVIPLAAAGRHLGRLALAFADVRQLSESEFELAKALANQAGLIFEASRLSEAARQAAIAQERERAAELRVAQLIKANAALTNAIDVLATEPAVDAMLSQTLRSICEQLVGADGSGTLWLIGPDPGRQRLHLVYEDRVVLFGATSGHPAAQRSEPVRAELFESRQPKARLHRLDLADMPVDQQRHLGAMGVRAVISLPMRLAGRPVGVFVIRLRDNQADPVAEQIELAQALAQQATLAVEMARLARRAEDAAVAREAAHASKERAEALARMGQAVSTSLESLAERLDLGRFLRQVLALCVEQVQADGGGLWLCSAAEAKEELVLEFRGGQVNPVLAFADSGPAPMGPLPSPDNAPPGQPRAGTVVLHDEHDIATRPEYEDHRATFEGLGVRSILVVPIYLRQQYRGKMTMRFANHVAVTPEQEALALALANQAAVAMELSRLADSAREAAVTSERNRLAGEIHDSLAQAFTGIVLQLQAARAGSSELTAASEFIDNAASLARDGLAEARRSVMALRPMATEQHGLLLALKRLATSASIAGQTRCDVVERLAGFGTFGPAVDDALYRICQEAVQNALRHARPGRITMTLTAQAGHAELTIEDDGCGMSPAAASASRAVGGLANMAARADQVAGDFSITSIEGRGTTVRVVVPLQGITAPRA